MLVFLPFNPSNFVSTHTVPCQRASAKEECESLARQLSISDLNATVVNTLAFASGCYYVPKNQKGSRLFFNTASARKTTSCTEKDKCVCKNGVFPKKSTGNDWWERKQDGMIFLGSEGHGRLLKQLASLAPSLFTSDVPVFIPEEYMSEIELRLDSNIIFYRHVAPNHVRFFDKFRLSFGRFEGWLRALGCPAECRLGSPGFWTWSAQCAGTTIFQPFCF